MTSPIQSQQRLQELLQRAGTPHGQVQHQAEPIVLPGVFPGNSPVSPLLGFTPGNSLPASAVNNGPVHPMTPDQRPPMGRSIMPPLPPASRPIGQYGQYFQPAYDQYQTNLGAAMVPGVGYIPGPNWQHSPLTMYSSAASAHITPVHAMTGQFVPASSGTIPSVSHNQAMHTSLPLASSVSAPPSIDGSMPAPPSRLSSVAPQTPPGGQIPPQPQFTPWSGAPNVSQPHGMTQSASMLPPPPPPPQMAVPGQLTAESIGRAIQGGFETSDT